MLRSTNPATGQVLEHHRELGLDELRGVLDRARVVFDEWHRESFAERAKCFSRLAALLREEATQHARRIAAEMGKPVAQGRSELECCAWVCDFYAEHSEGWLAPERTETDALRSWIQFDALGPLLCVMPWSSPYWQVFRFAAPALMAGNVVLLKHASNVQACARAIEGSFRRAGFPEGAFQNLAIGADRTAALTRDETIRGVSFTGGGRAGAARGPASGRGLKNIVLELGGSEPFIVLEDVDVARVAKEAARARALSYGQSSIAAQRFIVLEGVAASFIDAFRQQLDALRVGDPLDESTEVGPLASAEVVHGLHRQVRDSILQGARVVTGARRLDRPGFYYAPTLLADAKPGMRAVEEEALGPVASVIAVSREEDAVHIANGTPHGLATSVWCGDVERGVSLAARLNAASVAVNGIVHGEPRLPYGRVKGLGFSRELGKEGLREFVNTRSLWVGEPV